MSFCIDVNLLEYVVYMRNYSTLWFWNYTSKVCGEMYYNKTRSLNLRLSNDGVHSVRYFFFILTNTAKIKVHALCKCRFWKLMLSW